MKNKILVILLLITIGITFAEDSGGNPGKFTLLGANPRAIARGQAVCSVEGYNESYLYNPAALLGIKGYQISTAYQILALDRSIYTASFAGDVKGDAAFAISWVHAGTKIYGRDNDGIETGKLKNGQDNVTLAFAKKMYKSFTLGTSIRYMQANMEDIVAFTTLLDAGFVYRHRQTGLSGAFAVTSINIGGKMTWDSNDFLTEKSKSDDTVPMSFRPAVSYEPKFIDGNIEIGAEFTEYRDPRLHIGVTYIPIEMLEIHAGMDHNLPTGGISITSIRAGNFDFNFDYAISAERWELAPRHAFGLRVNYK